MKFSSKELCGLKAMIELAKHYPKGPISLAKVAEARGLPLPYLEQIIPLLRKAGLIESTRGARGGYKLAKPPFDITVGDVFRALEGNIVTLPCHIRKNCGIFEESVCYCDRDPECVAKDVWQEVYTLMAGFLDRLTLADLIS